MRLHDILINDFEDTIELIINEQGEKVFAVTVKDQEKIEFNTLSAAKGYIRNYRHDTEGCDDYFSFNENLR